MKNVVSKTVLKTVLVVIIALFVAFGTVSIGFPQHMATLFENMGIYSFATGYASLAYTYKGSIENLSRCVDDSILAGDDANIVNYGDKLVGREEFAEYAKKRTEEGGVDYFHLVYSHLAVSKYNRGDKYEALQTANESMTRVSDFPLGNALAALAIRSTENGDTEFSEMLLSAVKGYTPTAEQQEYYDLVIAILT